LLALALLAAPAGVVSAPVTVYQDYVFRQPPAVVLSNLPRLKGCAPDAAAVGTRILVFGDGGTGDAAQVQVAAAMQAFCEKNGCDLALMLGDNIYPDGVQGVADPRFLSQFEQPYAGLCIPVYAVLGEHDWGRKGATADWRAQIEYTGRSPRWRLPADVYSLTVGDLKILALNTNTLDTSPEQVAWLRRELETSAARWNLVLGHKPINSYGYHGDTDFMVAKALPLLCGKADLFIGAHEHNQQVLRADCGLPQIVSGSAGKLRTENPSGPRTLFAAAELGFTYLQVQHDAILVQEISARGEVRYSFAVPRRETAAPGSSGAP
jgi:hypothetical protein